MKYEIYWVCLWPAIESAKTKAALELYGRKMDLPPGSVPRELLDLIHILEM
jgi:hypothetical protein